MDKAERAVASRNWLLNFVWRRGAHLDGLSPELIAEIEQLREEIRREEGGGGMCHVVTEVLQMKYGWERLFVSYLSADGDVICGGGHVVNILPDGSVLDPTRDQFGEGFSVSLVRSDSEEIGRYRPEFYEDYFPGHPDIEGALDEWRSDFKGKMDWELQNENLINRGEGWWLSDKTELDTYIKQQEAYASIPASSRKMLI